ncbi:MAG: nucleotidyl transferase AbiEii/AbiGii toxin family protein [Armatimonadota bacterium]
MKVVGGSDATPEIRKLLARYARNRDEDFQLVLIQYAMERLLYRICRSTHSARFILKGAMLFRVWTDQPQRPTRDLDLLGSGSAEVHDLETAFREICNTEVEDDGLIVLPETVTAEEIREAQEYGGVRISMQMHLGKARIIVRVDIGFGDAVTPEATKIIYPTLLDLPAPVMLAYPRETVVAEKLEALVRLGMINSRMKDFYDLWVFSKSFTFDGNILTDAIAATFKRRGTQIPKDLPIAFTSEFYDDDLKIQQWSAFLKKGTVPNSYHKVSPMLY